MYDDVLILICRHLITHDLTIVKNGILSKKFSFQVIFFVNCYWGIVVFKSISSYNRLNYSFSIIITNV